jgi:hypothetical protein
MLTPSPTAALSEASVAERPALPRVRQAALKSADLVRLKNESGVEIDTSQLPKTLEAMTDDPYRSLAWFVRQKGGFCKSPREFAEFAWADWFRSKSLTLEFQNLPSTQMTGTPRWMKRLKWLTRLKPKVYQGILRRTVSEFLHRPEAIVHHPQVADFGRRMVMSTEMF